VPHEQRVGAEVLDRRASGAGFIGRVAEPASTEPLIEMSGEVRGRRC